MSGVIFCLHFCFCLHLVVLLLGTTRALNRFAVVCVLGTTLAVILFCLHFGNLFVCVATFICMSCLVQFLFALLREVIVFIYLRV